MKYLSWILMLPFLILAITFSIFLLGLELNVINKNETTGMMLFVLSFWSLVSLFPFFFGIMIYGKYK